MIFENEINRFKSLITDSLIRLIDNDYILLDLPYYTNIGDVLIWKGTEDFLSGASGKCLYRASIETYVRPDISTETIILLQGGGNFGDLWRRHTDFVMRVLNDFPDNKVIILPQTVHYKSREVLMADALQMSKHKNLIICARDKVTYQILNNHFKVSNILLLPDMAFCINSSLLKKYAKNSKAKYLFFYRKDVERAEYDFSRYLNQDTVEVREWPSMDKNLFASYILIGFSILRKRLPHILLLKRLTDWYAVKVYMPYLFRLGVRFISSYEKVYSTRLHGAILAIMLGKEVTFFDNSYGKNSSFFNSWLKDMHNVTFIPKDTQE